MQNLGNNNVQENQHELFACLDKDLDNIREFVDTANSRLDSIISITRNSHAIAADAVTAMICENQGSLSSDHSVNTTNKMSACLRDGEIILRYVSYLLLTKDESILEVSCLRDLKSTYISLGVPLINAIRVVELIKDSTISDIQTTSNYSVKDSNYLAELINETEFYFQKIIALLR